jgi:hypothetical protein
MEGVENLIFSVPMAASMETTVSQAAGAGSLIAVY